MLRNVIDYVILEWCTRSYLETKDLKKKSFHEIYHQGIRFTYAFRLFYDISFLRMRGFFLKNAWHFEDILREFEAFLN
jgi:hypothetical protein